MKYYLIWMNDDGKWIAKSDTIGGDLFPRTSNIAEAGMFMFATARRITETFNLEVPFGETVRAAMLEVPPFPRGLFKKGDE
jgi:hypothetical protein